MKDDFVSHFISQTSSRLHSLLDTFKAFLLELGMKPHMHLLEISIFSLNNVTVKPAKIMNGADKKLVPFLENQVPTLRIKHFKKYSKYKLGLLVQYSSKQKIGKIRPIFNPEKQNILRCSRRLFIILNFGKCDGDII